jgi:hypothetical protein
MPQHVIEAPHMNGVVAMPVKKIRVELDEIGYKGWWCEMRTNPRSELWDKFVTSPPEKNWEMFSPFILDWNFGDEDGNALPLPPETRTQDLPFEVPTYLVNKYLAAFNEAAGLPKAPEPILEDTSQIKSESPPAESV